MRLDKPTYRMYIDEVGNPRLGKSGHPNNQLLSLTAVIIKLDDETNIAAEIAALKRNYFGSDAVILHRNDIETARLAFKVLNDAQLRANFNRDLLQLLRAWNYVVVTVCIDKYSQYQKYRSLTYEPYHQGIGILLERYGWYLEDISRRGDVMVEARGKSEDIRLDKAFARFLNSGSRGERLQAVLTSKHLKIKPKALNIVGLQLADLLAYPSQLDILQYYGVPVQPSNLTAGIISLLANKYYQRDGVIYGKEFIQ